MSGAALRSSSDDDTIESCHERPANVKFRLNNSELWGGLIGLALGVFVIWSGLKLKLGTINDPGSGFVLFYTGILMCLFAVSIIVAARDRRRPDLRLALGRTRAGPSRCW